MFNYLIKIEYIGTSFVGWQYQKNGDSIQEKIEKALYKIFKKDIRIIGAGRTDKGVHAKAQYANFIIESKIKDEKKFINSINFFLRKTMISIIDIKKKQLSLSIQKTIAASNVTLFITASHMQPVLLRAKTKSLEPTGKTAPSE